MVNPELRRRLINSLNYLRGMDFFKDYSDLSSEEILDKIFSGEIDYETKWFVEELPKEERKKDREGIPGSSFEEHEEYWMKASDSEIDLKLAFFDIKRVFVEDPETVIERGICKILFKKLARISMGFFKPTYVRERMVKWKWEPPPGLGKAYYDTGFIFKVHFRFGGEEHLTEFYSDGDYINLNPVVKKINELIKDTGYQYYCPGNSDHIVYVVLSSIEVEKLKKRGWRFFPL
ncbi:MAG: hypothetical protein QXU11_09680 [Thermoproteota archaeon]